MSENKRNKKLFNGTTLFYIQVSLSYIIIVRQTRSLSMPLRITCKEIEVLLCGIYFEKCLFLDLI